MLGTLTELGLFFKFSPKRSKLLKSVIMEENERRDPDRKINTTKIRVFCETRWVERHIVLEEVKLLYDPILKTLEKITTEKGWDHKSIDSAFGLLKNITDSAFIVAVSVCSYTLGFTKPLSTMLQGTSMDVIAAYKNIELVKDHLNVLCRDCDRIFAEDVWNNCQTLAAISGTELNRPRICGRQTQRTNIPSTTAEEYYKLAVFIPTIDHMITQLDFQFSQIQKHATQGMYLIPQNLSTLNNAIRDDILKVFEWALPSAQTFYQEVDLWKTKWRTAGVHIPQTLKDSLNSCDERLFPNIYTCLHLLMIIPVSTATVE